MPATWTRVARPFGRLRFGGSRASALIHHFVEAPQLPSFSWGRIPRHFARSSWNPFLKWRQLDRS